MTEISLVLDSKLCPTIPSMPVAISMNFEGGQEEQNMQRTPVLTELLPVPVGPMMLYDTFQMDESWELLGGPYATMASFVDKSSIDTFVTRDLPKFLRREIIRSEAAFT